MADEAMSGRGTTRTVGSAGGADLSIRVVTTRTGNQTLAVVEGSTRTTSSAVV